MDEELMRLAIQRMIEDRILELGELYHEDCIAPMLLPVEAGPEALLQMECVVSRVLRESIIKDVARRAKVGSGAGL